MPTSNMKNSQRYAGCFFMPKIRKCAFRYETRGGLFTASPLFLTVRSFWVDIRTVFDLNGENTWEEVNGMSWRIGVVSKDELFLNRFLEAMRDQHSADVEAVPFLEPRQAVVAAMNFSLDLILLDAEYAKKRYLSALSELPRTCRVIWLAEDRLPEPLMMIDGHLWTRKYQNVDDYNSYISRICTGEFDSAMEPRAIRVPEGTSEEEPDRPWICLFTSAAGGVGTSTAAAAFAVHCSGPDTRILYLDLQTFGNTAAFFSGTSRYTLEDLILGLRRERYDPETLLHHTLIQNMGGPSYIAPCALTSNRFSMTGEEVVKLFDLVEELETFDGIVADVPTDASELIILPFLRATRTVLVTSGTAISNHKTELWLQTVPTLAGVSAEDAAGRIRLLYNRYPKTDGVLMQRPDLGKLGGLREIPNRKTKELIQFLSERTPFARLEEDLHV